MGFQTHLSTGKWWASKHIYLRESDGLPNIFIYGEVTGFQAHLSTGKWWAYKHIYLGEVLGFQTL